MTVGAVDRVSCLHLLAGGGPEALDACRSQCRAGDAVLLIDAAVLHLLKAGMDTFVSTGCRLYCLNHDLEAHGLSAAIDSFPAEPVDDSRFPGLLREHDHCLSWA
jgi:sulfur relay protein TusB/DsrH